MRKHQKDTVAQTVDIRNSPVMNNDKQRRIYVDDLTDGYYEADLRGALIVANNSLCNIFGCDDLNAISGDKYFRRMDEENMNRLREAFHTALETGKSISTVECQIARMNGDVRTVEFSIALLRGRSDEPIGFRGIVRDVTERSRAETLRSQQIDLLSVLSQVDIELNQMLALNSVLLIALNAALLLSSAETGFIGLAERDHVRLARAVGNFTQQWMPLDVGIVARVIRTQRAELVTDVSADPDYCADIPTTRAEIAIPLVAHSKLVGVLNLETASDRFTSQIFEFVQVLAARIATAIENARLYEALQARLDELSTLYTQVSNLEALKTDMIRVAAHDLRSPLAVVASYVELLAEDLEPVLEDQTRMYIDAIRQAIARMTQMTTDILSLERLHEHREGSLACVRLGSLLEHSINEHLGEMRQHRQEINLFIDPVLVYGNSSELYEAIANLVVNAIKYTPEGGKIEAHLHSNGEEASLEIVDTGYGIPEEEQANLFQPFHRIKTSETYTIEGTGLGLYLVKKIIERHGGTVHFHSEYGNGSTFGFCLPLAKPSESGEPVANG